MPLAARKAAHEARSPALEHHDSLDGIRGLAVAAVLVFHADLAWASGGYLGVSAFFTLSGFLITTLLLTEHTRTGTIGLGSFWARRVRRLLPAALVTIAGALAYVAAFGDAAAIERIRGDALAALAYVANWRFISTDLSYAELFTGDSPLQHLWSLAIEEQFYLVLPLAAVLARRATDPARRLALVASVALAGSLSVSILVDGTDRLYYGTDSRAAELLVGVLLACAHHRLDVRRRIGAPARRLAGGVALVVMVGMWATVEQTSSSMHPWVLLFHAALTAVVIVSAMDAGPVTTALEWRPLVALGIISYGVYLYHWPIYLWLDEARTGLSGPTLLGLRLATTAAVAVASHRFLENPIRRGRSLPRPAVAGRAIVAIGATGALVLATTAIVDRPPLIDFAAAQAAFDEVEPPPPPPSTTTPSTTAVGPTTTTEPLPAFLPNPRVAVFGDSTALVLVPGLLQWSERTGELQLVEGATLLGCGITRLGDRTAFDEWLQPLIEGCAFDVAWPPALAARQPEVAVVQSGLWDIVERRLPGDDTVRSIGDPVYDQYLRSELRAAVDLLLGSTERIVWTIQPPPVRSTRADDDPVFERVELLNEMIIDLFLDDPDVGLVDLAAWLRATPEGTESLELRPDGTHFGRASTLRVAEFLGPAILRALREPTQIIGPEDVG